MLTSPLVGGQCLLSILSSLGKRLKCWGPDLLIYCDLQTKLNRYAPSCKQHVNPQVPLHLSVSGTAFTGEKCHQNLNVTVLDTWEDMGSLSHGGKYQTLTQSFHCSSTWWNQIMVKVNRITFCPLKWLIKRFGDARVIFLALMKVRTMEIITATNSVWDLQS